MNPMRDGLVVGFSIVGLSVLITSTELAGLLMKFVFAPPGTVISAGSEVTTSVVISAIEGLSPFLWPVVASFYLLCIYIVARYLDEKESESIWP